MIEQRAEVSVDFLKRFADAWNRHDVDELMTYMTEDCVFESPVGTEAYGTRYEGAPAVREGFAGVLKRLQDAHWGEDKHFVSGDRGLSEWRLTATLADGKRMDVTGCDVFQFRNGKIAVKNSYVKSRPPI
jgi:ketosteroid isomerase-like protein